MHPALPFWGCWMRDEPFFYIKRIFWIGLAMLTAYCLMLYWPDIAAWFSEP